MILHFRPSRRAIALEFDSTFELTNPLDVLVCFAG